MSAASNQIKSYLVWFVVFPLSNGYCFYIVWYIVVSLYGVILYYSLYYILIFVLLILCILPRGDNKQMNKHTAPLLIPCKPHFTEEIRLIHSFKHNNYWNCEYELHMFWIISEAFILFCETGMLQRKRRAFKINFTSRNAFKQELSPITFQWAQNHSITSVLSLEVCQSSIKEKKE